MSGKLETMTPELKAFVGEWKDKPGNLIMVLHKVQQTYGYIPREIAIEIAEMLHLKQRDPVFMKERLDRLSGNIFLIVFFSSHFYEPISGTTCPEYLSQIISRHHNTKM